MAARAVSTECEFAEAICEAANISFNCLVDLKIELGVGEPMKITASYIVPQTHAQNMINVVKRFDIVEKTD